MSTYGFKLGSPNDTVAIATLMQRRGSIEDQDYEGLAQYKIKDIELRPTNVAVNQPRRWTLALNTTLIGMNMPNRKALWFGNDDRAVGDGYTTVDLNADQFAKMIQGGLYVDPNQYLKRLKDKLADQNFYRQSKLHLTTIKVPDTAQLISAGDFSQKRESGRMYLIGQDQQAYLNLNQAQAQSLPTNLPALLDEQITSLTKDPLTKIAQTPIPERYRQDQAQLETGLAGLRNAPALQAQIQAAKNPKLPKVVQEQRYQSTTTKGQIDETVSSAVNSVNTDSMASRNAKQTASLNEENSLHFGTVDVPDTDVSPVALASTDEMQGQNQSSQATAPVESNGDNGEGVAVDVDMPIASESTAGYDELMAKIDEAMPSLDSTAGVKKRHHVYVDDFSQVAKSSQVQQQKRRQQVSNAVSQNEPKANKDDGLLI